MEMSFKLGNPKVNTIRGFFVVTEEGDIGEFSVLVFNRKELDIDKMATVLCDAINGLRGIQLLLDNDEDKIIFLLCLNKKIKKPFSKTVYKVLDELKDIGNKTFFNVNKIFVKSKLKSNQNKNNIDHIQIFSDQTFNKNLQTITSISELLKTETKISQPVCPVCLEDFNNNKNPILTLICTHKIHIFCLSSSSSFCCPICRYKMKNSDIWSCCVDCKNKSNLWLCLLCGDPHCDINGHALNHFESTNHIYAQNLDTREVFDFCENQYASRLIATENENKIVRYSNMRKGQNEQEEEEFLNDKLAEGIKDFDNLLSEQTVSLQKYYDDLEKDIKKQFKSENEKLLADIEDIKIETKEVTKQKNKVSEEIKNLESELKSKKEESNKLERKCGKLENLNKAILINQKKIKSEFENFEKEKKKLKENIVAAKRAKIKELNEQIKDLEAHLKITKKLKEANALDGGICITSTKVKGKKK